MSTFIIGPSRFLVLLCSMFRRRGNWPDSTTFCVCGSGVFLFRYRANADKRCTIAKYMCLFFTGIIQYILPSSTKRHNGQTHSNYIAYERRYLALWVARSAWHAPPLITKSTAMRYDRVRLCVITFPKRAISCDLLSLDALLRVKFMRFFLSRKCICIDTVRTHIPQNQERSKPKPSAEGQRRRQAVLSIVELERANLGLRRCTLFFAHAYVFMVVGRSYLMRYRLYVMLKTWRSCVYDSLQ